MASLNRLVDCVKHHEIDFIFCATISEIWRMSPNWLERWHGWGRKPRGLNAKPEASGSITKLER